MVTLQHLGGEFRNFHGLENRIHLLILNGYINQYIEHIGLNSFFGIWLAYLIHIEVTHMSGGAVKSIFEYLDYRQYLRDFYEARRASGKISLRLFSKKADLKAPNYLKLVIEGKRNLTGKTIYKFVQAIGFKKEEAEFFENLVCMNQAESHDEKNAYYRKLSRITSYLKAKHIEKDQYEFLSEWYYAAIREMTLLSNFVLDYEWIGRSLRPQLTARQAEKAVALLIRLGLVVRDESGRLLPSDRSVSSGNEVACLGASNFHIQMLARAAEYVANSKAAHREVSSLTVALSPEKFEAAKKKIQDFRREMHAFLADCSDPQLVYQLNFQFFPLMEAPDGSA